MHAEKLRLRRDLLDALLFPLRVDSATCRQVLGLLPFLWFVHMHDAASVADTRHSSVDIDLPVGSLRTKPVRVSVGVITVELSRYKPTASDLQQLHWYVACNSQPRAAPPMPCPPHSPRACLAPPPLRELQQSLRSPRHRLLPLFRGALLFAHCAVCCWRSTALI